MMLLTLRRGTGWAVLFSAVLAAGGAPAQSREASSGSDRMNESSPPSPPAALAKDDLAALEKSIAERVNTFRKEHELDPVQVDAALTKAARDFADFMARTGKYGHHADGRTPKQRAEAAGYKPCIVAENIASQFSSVEVPTEKIAGRFFRGWEESKSHRRNMLDDAVTETGIAVAQSESDGTRYAVQLFGLPESAMVEFSLANESDQTIAYQIDERSYELPMRGVVTHGRCTRVDVTLAPDTDAAKTIRPRAGERIVIAAVSSENGEISIRREEKPAAGSADGESSPCGSPD